LLGLVTAPLHPDEASSVAEVGDHLVQRAELERVRSLKCLRALEEPCLELLQLAPERLRQARGRQRTLLPRQPVHQLDLAGVGVAPADVQAKRNPLKLPVRLFFPWPLIGPIAPGGEPSRLQPGGPPVDDLPTLA